MKNNYINPQNECFRGYAGITCLSVLPCVRVSFCVQNTTFCQSAGGSIKSHLVSPFTAESDRIIKPHSLKSTIVESFRKRRFENHFCKAIGLLINKNIPH